MPIRINLLAEAQAQEDMRRRDPVKRTLIAGAFFVALMLAWSLLLWLKSATLSGEIATLKARFDQHSQENKEVLNNLKETGEINTKLTALDKLSTNRFLVANVLDALQRTTMDNIQLVRLRFDDSLTYAEEVKANTEAKRAAKPATVTESSLLLLDVKDSCSKPGDLIPQFQQLIAQAPYFVTMQNQNDQQRVKLKEGSYSQVQTGPDNRQYMTCTLECHFPEKIR